MKKLFSLLTIIALTFVIFGCGKKTTVKTKGPQDFLLDAKDSLVLVANGTIVESDITLPTLSDYTLTWESSHPEYISTSGVVTRPDNSVGNVEVTLTATISDTVNNLTETKEFKVTVKALDLTDEQCVAKFKEEIANALPSETSEKQLTLPVAKYGVDVQYTSSNEAVISTTGAVNRPTVVDGAAEVTITANITKGTVSAKVTWKVKVLPTVEGVYGHIDANKEALPYTFKLSTEDGAELYLPYGNVNKDRMFFDNLYGYVYLPTFGEKTPSELYSSKEAVISNTKGVAYVVENNVITAVYDGDTGKKYDANNMDGVELQASENATAPREDYYKAITIPQNGYVLIFVNNSNKGLDAIGFGKNILGTNASAVGKKLEMTGLKPTSVGVAITAEIHWRGQAEVTVPFKFIDPRINLDNGFVTEYSKSIISSTTVTTDGAAPAANGSNVKQAFPLVFTSLTTKRQKSNSINLGSGYAISTVLNIEPDETQTMALQGGGDEYTFNIPYKYEVYKVYDGIAGQIKIKDNPSVPSEAADIAKDMQIDENQVLVSWVNSGVSYTSDTYNRRVAADYFYAPNGWVCAEYAVDELAATGSNIDSSDDMILQIVEKILNNVIQ